MISMMINCPPISMKFDPHLLSKPIFKFDADYLHKISEFLKKKVNSSEFKGFPATLEKLKHQQQQFMELYERAKIEEGKAKEKKNIKTQWFGYRPRLDNQHDQRLFERLAYRSYTSASDRGHNKI